MDAGSTGVPDTIQSLIAAQGSVFKSVQPMLPCLTLVQQILLERLLRRQPHKLTLTPTRLP